MTSEIRIILINQLVVGIVRHLTTLFSLFRNNQFDKGIDHQLLNKPFDLAQSHFSGLQYIYMIKILECQYISCFDRQPNFWWKNTKNCKHNFKMNKHWHRNPMLKGQTSLRFLLVDILIRLSSQQVTGTSQLSSAFSHSYIPFAQHLLGTDREPMSPLSTWAGIYLPPPKETHLNVILTEYFKVIH